MVNLPLALGVSNPNCHVELAREENRDGVVGGSVGLWAVGLSTMLWPCFLYWATQLDFGFIFLNLKPNISIEFKPMLSAGP